MGKVALLLLKTVFATPDPVQLIVCRVHGRPGQVVPGLVRATGRYTPMVRLGILIAKKSVESSETALQPFRLRTVANAVASPQKRSSAKPNFVLATAS